MRRVPNVLTFLRLALIPLFVLLMIEPSNFERWLATVIFIFAALTDVVDGFIARRYQAVSDTGKLLDPLADKILVMAALVMLCGQRSPFTGLPWVPAWMVVVVLAREIWVTGLRGLAAERGRVLAASQSGKLKSFLQMTAIVFMLAQDVTIPLLPEFLSRSGVVGVNLLLVSIIISLWSALEYSLLVLGGESWVPALRQTENKPGELATPQAEVKNINNDQIH